MENTTEKTKQYVHSRALEGFKPEPWSPTATFIPGFHYRLDKYQRKAIRRRFGIDPSDVVECVKEESFDRLVCDYEGKFLVGWKAEIGRPPAFKKDGATKEELFIFHIDARELVIYALTIKVEMAAHQKRRALKLREKNGTPPKKSSRTKTPALSNRIQELSDAILGI